MEERMESAVSRYLGTVMMPLWIGLQDDLRILRARDSANDCPGAVMEFESRFALYGDV